jgi:hypothetical protein
MISLLISYSMPKTLARTECNGSTRYPHKYMPYGFEDAVCVTGPPILTGLVIELGLAKVPQGFSPGCYTQFLTGPL